jgi:hypothetical protein
MPRAPTERKNKKLWIVCPRCRYRWSPDPRKWNNWCLTNNHEKVLSCPSCGSRVRVAANVLREILKHRGIL